MVSNLISIFGDGLKNRVNRGSDENGIKLNS